MLHLTVHTVEKRGRLLARWKRTQHWSLYKSGRNRNFWLFGRLIHTQRCRRNILLCCCLEPGMFRLSCPGGAPRPVTGWFSPVSRTARPGEAGLHRPPPLNTDYKSRQQGLAVGYNVAPGCFWEAETGDSLLRVLVLYSEPLVELLLSDSLLGQPPDNGGSEDVRKQFTAVLGYSPEEGCTHRRYWSLVLRSWMRSGLMLFILLSISL